MGGVCRKWKDFYPMWITGQPVIRCLPRYSKNTVRGIVDQIARMELSSGECFIDKIHYLNPDTKQDDVEYRDGILSDLEERSVIRKNGKKCSINIKLYTLWIKTQL